MMVFSIISDIYLKKRRFPLNIKILENPFFLLFLLAFVVRHAATHIYLIEENPCPVPWYSTMGGNRTRLCY